MYYLNRFVHLIISSTSYNKVRYIDTFNIKSIVFAGTFRIGSFQRVFIEAHHVQVLLYLKFLNFSLAYKIIFEGFFLSDPMVII